MKPFVAAKWKGAKCDGPACNPRFGDRVVCALCDGTGKVPYDLAGYLWTPEMEVGMVGMAQDSGKLYLIDKVDGWAGVQITRALGGQDRGVALPLLPSSERINAQPKPREVAIAALERAGFERLGTREWGYDGIIKYRNLDTGEAWEVSIIKGKTIFWCNKTDPTLAQYAVDCFKVLKAWADAIEWGAK